MQDPTTPTPLEHPSAWNGETLGTRPEWHHELSMQEQAELLKLARDPVHLESDPLEQHEASHFSLPHLERRLTAIRSQLEHGAGLVRLRRLPIDTLDETQVKTMFWAMALHLGTPLSQSARGERIFSVRDAGFGEKDPRARGPNTRKRLSFHTDRCDVIGFLCLKDALEGGDNEVVSSMSLYNVIQQERPDLLKVLMEPFPYLRHTVDEGNDTPWCQQPIFSFQEGHFACAFLRVLIDRAHKSPDLPDLRPVQIEALDFLETVAADPKLQVRFRQEPGDLLFLNNWVTLHRRTAFIDHEDPAERRHILRLWLAMPNSRPLHPLFQDNYGATEAGAVRGGMQANAGDSTMNVER